MNPVEKNLRKKYFFSDINVCFVLHKKIYGRLKQNCEFHEHNTRRIYDLHAQFNNTSLVQKSVLPLEDQKSK